MPCLMYDPWPAPFNTRVTNMPLRRLRILLLPAMLLPVIPGAAQQTSLQTDQQQYGYAVGTRIAAQLMAQFGQGESGIDMQALAAGISDMINGAELLMSDEEAIRVIEDRQLALQRNAEARAQSAARQGEAWRAENRKRAGVTQTESGLQYSVIRSGEASAPSPGPDDTVVVHYRGTFLDGTEFDSSYSRGVPVTFPLNGIIPGWQEALQLMRAGDRWNVVIPPELAYGPSGSGTIGPNETLLFEIELIEVKGG